MRGCIVVLLLICIAIVCASASIGPPSDLRDLPLSEVPAAHGGDTLALFITGDGGWAELDQHVSAELARGGIPVVGLSSLKYFWHARTPELAAHDVSQVLHYYLEAWHRKRILLIGYSFGADVMPFIVTRLPADLHARLTTVSLLGLSANASFEISAADLLNVSSAPTMPVAPQIARLGNVRVLCVYGDGEKESLCPSLAQGRVTSLRIGEGHHFSGDYPALAKAITAYARRAAVR